jgi:hypothetical protein
MSDIQSSRSWFCVFNNPSRLFGDDLSPEEMVYRAIDMWCDEKPQRTCAVNYEIGDSGTPHMHMVLEDPSKTRFSAVQKLFPSIHIEPTRGNKKQAEDYILKKGCFEEKEHTVIVPAVFHGEIAAAQGKRNDLFIIEDLLAQGRTPSQIMNISITYRKHETLIRKAFFAKRCQETPTVRELTVFWHVGESGSGKSYTYKTLVEERGEDKVYLLTDYENGGFDMYEGQPILFMDEFKGNIRFQQLLNYLDVYKTQVHCRFANVTALWTEVHITSIFPPEEVYRFMVDEGLRSRDKIQQLMRRLTYIIYHYVDGKEYKCFWQDAPAYTDYETLKHAALQDCDGFRPVDCETPFS